MLVSHYRVEHEIGRGGMGVVYRAVDTRLGRAAALKLLPADASGDPERRRRFIREAQAASALNHPNIVTIYEVGEDAGTTFIAMELVDGTPLDRLLAAGPLPLADALACGTQIADALDVAHRGGIVHRDIKPANIIVTRDGRAKVLDFGLAKLVQRAPTEVTLSAMTTEPGTVMGTAAYMSPEQAEGRPVDARSDIFSFGSVLYEMLAGRRAFQGATPASVISAILRDQPPAVRSGRPEVPAEVDSILQRALEKDPAARYPDAGAIRRDLAAVHAGLTRPPDAWWRRPAVLVPVALLLLAAAGAGVWQTVQARRGRWARQEAIPEIERLQSSGRNLAAVRLAREVERLAPAEIARIRHSWYGLTLSTSPEGADVEIRDYLDTGGTWLPLGQTPVAGERLPFGYFRFRIRKAGYLPVDLAATPAARQAIQLVPEAEAREGMVMVRGGRFGVGIAAPVELPDFWIDRLELTNREYKRFVDAGGYREPKYWPPFSDGGRAVSFEQAMARFRDATGQSGPSTWQLGSYPEGQAELPVGGISWFEASAYARFAGKALPTVYHWYRAAPRDELSSEILLLSNFDGNGPVKAGERQGLGPSGTLDMAGNVKEWCANGVEGGELRYILGGGWNEPHYRYAEEDARNPWERRATFGVRLIAGAEAGPAASGPIARLTGDPKGVVPVADDLFAAYRSTYSYDRTPLNAVVEATEHTEHWRMEKVSFDAAYGGERVPAYLFLPANASPPYQTVVLFPSGYARNTASSQHLDYARFDFIIRSGRALLYPVYQGTYERRKPQPDGPSQLRDLHVQWAKDFFRAVDYLETRSEIDMTRLAYYSLSVGAYFGPIPVALDSRIRTAVFASGGLRFDYPAEVHPANFMPRVKVPVLLINGRDDFQTPPEAQRRMLELLGSPPEHKVLVQLDGGHVPSDNLGMIRHVLQWFDKYLGEVRR